MSSANGSSCVHGGLQLLAEGAVVAQAGEGVHLGADLDGPVRQRVLQGDRGMGREDAHEVELPRLEAGVLAPALEVEDAEHAVASPQRRQDERRRVRAGTPHAAGLALGQDLGDDAAGVGQAARQEGFGTHAAGQQRAELALAGPGGRRRPGCPRG